MNRNTSGDHQATSSQRLPRSVLARMQQMLVVIVLASVLVSLWWLWDRVRWLGIVTALMILLGYTVVLALEFVAVARVSRGDRVAAASATVLFLAWWKEVRVAPQVFCWRQPFRWRTLPDTQHPLPGSTNRPAAVFVHGFVCNRGFWLPWMRALRVQGIPYTSVNLEPVFGSIADYIPGLEEAICRAERLTGIAPVLICHSMGGLAARAWLADAPRAAQRVQRVITIGTPHHGTWISQFSHVPNGQQMRLNHEWLTTLATAETAVAALPYQRFVCWYSNADNIVLPASSAMLQGADNRHVPGVAHVALAFHPTVMRESLAMIASASSSPAARTVS